MFARLGRDIWTALVEASSVRHIAARRPITFDRADRPSLAFQIEGWIYRARLTFEGNRQISTLLLPGDVCDIEHLTGESMWAFTDTTLLAVPRERALRLGERFAEFGRFLMASALRECAILRERNLYMGRHNALARLAHLLCELDCRLGVGAANMSGFDWPVTQAEIADMLGLTPVHVNRVLQQLRRDGLITIERHHVHIVDVAALRKIAEFDPAYLRVGQRRRLAFEPLLTDGHAGEAMPDGR
jgi:CRP-like cAMP-binding protein